MPIDTYIDAHADDTEIRVCRLLKIEFDSGTVYWTDFQIPVQALSQRWTPKPIAITGIGSEQGESGGATVEIGDANLMGAAYITGTETIVGIPVRIYDAWLDPAASNTIAAGTKLTYEGRLGNPVSARTGDKIVTRFPLAPYADLRIRKFPKRFVSAKCPFVYQDEFCQASGGSDTSCEKTYQACSQPSKLAGNPIGGNRARFGGVQWIPPDGYVIEWGEGSFVLRAAPASK